MCRSCSLRFFRTWPPHDEGQRYQKHHKKAKYPEGIHEAEHIRLQVDLCGKLRQSTMRGFAGARAHSNKVLRDGVKLPLKKWIGMICMRGQRRAVNLPLPGDEVIQHRNADGPAHVTHEVADPGNLIEFISRYPNIVECADRNKYQWNADNLDYAIYDHGVKAHAVIDIGDMEEPKRSDGETHSDDDAWVELGSQNACDRHHERKSDSAR